MLPTFHLAEKRKLRVVPPLCRKGISIDESTAIIVQKSIAKVVGLGRVHFYDSTMPIADDSPYPWILNWVQK